MTFHIQTSRANRRNLRAFISQLIITMTPARRVNAGRLDSQQERYLKSGSAPSNEFPKLRGIKRSKFKRTVRLYGLYKNCTSHDASVISNRLDSKDHRGFRLGNGIPRRLPITSCDVSALDVFAARSSRNCSPGKRISLISLQVKQRIPPL